MENDDTTKNQQKLKSGSLKRLISLTSYQKQTRKKLPKDNIKNEKSLKLQIKIFKSKRKH